MELFDYYIIIKEKIELGDYTIEKISPEATIPEINSHLEAIHYLMAEYMRDRKDQRLKEIFDYVCVPNGVNTGEIDIDFTKWDFEKFMKGLIKLKD